MQNILSKLFVLFLTITLIVYSGALNLKLKKRVKIFHDLDIFLHDYNKLCLTTRLTQKGRMYADCRVSSGRYIYADIDLNRCFTNNDGYITPQYNGYYTKSCSDCNIYDPYLECSCRNNHGKLVRNKFDLRPYLGFYKGLLGCRQN